MMVHLFTKFTATPEDMPLGRALAAAPVPNVLFGSHVRRSYRGRLGFVFGFLPRLVWDAVRSAGRSLILARPRPDVVVLNSDIEVLVFAALRLFLPRPRPVFVLLGFIYTERADPVLNALRRRYFGFVLGRVGRVICHSRREVERNRARFRARAAFVFVPWGTDVAIRDALARTPPTPADGDAEYIVTAGKSGRDYPTLARALQGVTMPLRIICDYAPQVAALADPDGRISILATCHGDDYIRELYRSRIVVVPLAVDDISAGQMVLLQAMALGKPVIVTRTATTTDYATDERDALLVPRGDPAALRAAILRLLADPALAARLGAAALETYERQYTTERFVGNVLAAVTAAPAVPDENRPPGPG